MANIKPAHDKPKFSAGLVVSIVTLFFVAVFGFAVFHGISDIPRHQVQNAAK